MGGRVEQVSGGKMIKRRGPRLNPGDLKKFGRKFCSDISALMPGRDFRLVPLSEFAAGAAPGADDMVIPLKHRGRELGYLIVSGDGRVWPRELDEFLPEITRQGLETMWLRKSLLTDRETGLYSRDYFEKSLVKALKKHRRGGAARSLSMSSQAAPELLLVLAELRAADDPASSLTAWAARLQGRLSPRSLCRFGSRKLAFLVEGQPEEVRQNLESALDDQLEAEPASRPVAAWIRYPHDLEDRAGLGEAEGLPTHGRAKLLMERAGAALFQARQSRGAAVGVAFGDLVENHGQVVQVLPLDRVIINLGRVTGAAVGQVFLASAPVERPSVEAECKGEITIFEIADSYSVGHITGHTTASRIVAGDRLVFSRREAALEAQLGEAGFTPPGFLSLLPAPEEFLARLDEFADRPVTLVLARLDGFEKTVAMLGREEAGRILTFVFEKVAAAFPKGLKTLWQSDLLAVAWPGGEQAEIKPLCFRLAEELREAGPVSFGLVFSPGGQSPENLVDDARKALNEAAFSGPGQVAVFGPLALNVSGDRLFEGGDLSGALKEYERGLALSPGHLNLLNSLGVCHGRLGNSRQALEIFQQIAELDPLNMMAHYNLGYTHLLSGRMIEAEESMGRAAELAPDNFESFFHLGKIALELGHLDRALPALKRAGELGEGRPMVFRLLGEALMLAHDHQGALAAFKKAVKAAPNDAYALSTLGALFVDLANDLEVARSLYQKSVEIDPTNSLYRQRLGRLLFSLGDLAGAEHHLTQAVEYGSRAPEVHYHLGRLAEETGRSEQAVSHYQAALSQDPAYKPALERLMFDDFEDDEPGALENCPQRG